jgi:hypothetical protein
VGKQFIEAVVRVGADAHEQIAKIGKGLDAQALAACDQTAQYGSRSSAFVATIKKPVTPPHHDWAEAALGTVIIYLQVAVFRVAQSGKATGLTATLHCRRRTRFCLRRRK